MPLGVPLRRSSGSMSSGGDRRDQGISELSRLLLEGWTMLAETCPRDGCHMPLARSHGSGVVKCPGCGLEVRNQDSGSAEHSAEVVVPAEIAQEDHEMGESVVGREREVVMAPATAQDCAREPEVRSASRDDRAAKALGDRLLTGWTMMADACARCNTPLMKKGSIIECVECGGEGAVNNLEPRKTQRDPAEGRREKGYADQTQRNSSTLLRAPGPVASQLMDVLSNAREKLVGCMRNLTERLEQSEGTVTIGDTCYALSECARALETVERSAAGIRELREL